jgi:hypothetical protein
MKVENGESLMYVLGLEIRVLKGAKDTPRETFLK